MSVSHPEEGKVECYLNDFKQYGQKRLSVMIWNAFTSYINEYHITDNDFKKVENDVTKYSNYLIGKEGANEHSSLIFKQCNYNKLLMLNLSVHIECFPYHKSEEFHAMFLRFSKKTFTKLRVEDRKSCYLYIIDQVK